MHLLTYEVQARTRFEITLSVTTINVTILVVYAQFYGVFSAASGFNSINSQAAPSAED